jgi:uncharacterized protein
MALPLSGLKDRELLKVETEDISITIKGRPVHPTVQELKLNQNEQGEWQKARFSITSFSTLAKAYVFDPFKAIDNLTHYHSGTETFPCFYETQNYSILIQGKESTNLSFYHENKTIRDAVSSSQNTLWGTINLASDIGYSELEIRNHDKPYVKIVLEVFPAKLDYQKDFQTLLREVNEEIYNLAYDFLRRTYFSAGLSPNRNATLTEFFSIINVIFSSIVKALSRVSQNPHHKIISITNVERIEKVKRFNNESVRWLGKHPEVLAHQSSQTGLRIGQYYYVPERLQQRKKIITYDTFENRFVKWVIKQVANRLKGFQNEYATLYKEDSSRFDIEIDKKLSRMQVSLQKLLRMDFLQEVSELQHFNNLSLVLQMAPGYRDVYRYYLMLSKGLTIQSDVYRISQKELWQLYEYWCFLAINKLLRQKYKLVRNNLVKATNKGLVVKLRQDRLAKLEYVNPRNGEAFELSYQDSNYSPTLKQVPDNVLSLRKKGSSINYRYVFDAKYRINAARDKSYQKKYGKPGPEEDDINTMHRYRDAIVYESKDKGFEKNVYGAFVLFPYGDEELYCGETDGKPHKFYESIQKVNIGALPFLPGHTKLVENFLDELILDTPETAVERSVFHEGTEQYYQEKFLKKNVFVGSTKTREQWEINHRSKFYHTPLRNVMDVLGNLEYVAVYRRKGLFEKDFGIKHYGKITYYKIMPRTKIAEIPSSNNELYVRFEIEDWVELSPGIVPLHYGVSDKLLTTLPLLLQARELPELKLETEFELRIWKELVRLIPSLNVIATHQELDTATVKLVSLPEGELRVEGSQLICKIGEQTLFRSLTDRRKSRLEIFRELKTLFKTSLRNTL